MVRAALWLSVCLALAACRDDRAGPAGADTDTGPETASDGTADPTGTTGAPLDAPDGVGAMGMRRLTRVELDNTVADLLGDTTRPGTMLMPEDRKTPFDNDFATQQASRVLIEAAETMASDLAEAVVGDPARRDAIVPCTPAGPDDDACLDAFVRAFGRRALRRALDDAEVADLVALGRDYAMQGGDFWIGVEEILRALLQDAEFLYRIEIGSPVDDEPGVYRLSGYEVATRMAYLLWGSTPDDDLLDRAEAGLLDDADGRREAALAMLDTPRGRAQVDRFHALWLGYAELPHAPALTHAMRTETAAAIERVVFEEDASWLELFALDETFVDDALAEHYGLPAPGSATPQWVAYGSSGRQGILSHGAFLSVATNPDDTSPTKRGKLIRNRLLCEEIPPPPPDAPADTPPSEGDCKWDRYAAHRSEGSCKACHEQMDPIGFGLENYDAAGRFRTHDLDAPECAIEGVGELVGLGTFRGPAELSDLVVAEGQLDACIVEHAYRFAMGHDVGDHDVAYVDALAAGFADDGHRFAGLLVDLVAHDAFAYRREE